MGRGTNPVWNLHRTPRIALTAVDLENRNNDKEDVSKLTIQKGFANFWGKVDQSAAVHILGSIQEAVEFVETCAQANGNTEIFVTGSIHLVGGIISIVEEGILP